jgi:uncharacterized cupin superfamily protein
VITNWDELEGSRRERGHIAAAWTPLSGPNSITVGVNRVPIDPGMWSTPLHLEGSKEEIFYVLDGSGAEEDHPWTREAVAGPPGVAEISPRPRRIVNVDYVDVTTLERGDVGCEFRDLGRAAGSERTGVKHITVPPGKLAPPPHCHSAEEELFVVLEGAGTLELSPSAPDSQGYTTAPDSHPVRAGSTVARPARTRVAHAFRAGREGLTVLAYGTRDSHDIAYYPRSNKLYFRGIGVVPRVEPVEYWDGED